MEPLPPSNNETVTNPHYYTSHSIDVDDESEELGSSVDPLRDERNSSSSELPPHNIRESQSRTADSSYHISDEPQYRTNESHLGYGAPSQTMESQYRATESHSGSEPSSLATEFQYRTNESPISSEAPSLTHVTETQYRRNGSPSGSGSPTQTAETQYRTTGSHSGFGTPQTMESQYRATGSHSGSGSPTQRAEPQYRTTGSHSGFGTPQSMESQYRATGSLITSGPSTLSMPSVQPQPSESSAQNLPPPPSYTEAFLRPDQARNIMQSAQGGMHRNPMEIDPEQPPPSYSAVVSSQGSRYYPPVNAQPLNSSYATQPSTSGINRCPERTYGSGSHCSYNKQGYQRMPHGSYAPVSHNTNEQSGLTAPSIAIYNSYHPARSITSTGIPGNVQGYNTTPLAYVDPNSVPQEKTNTYCKMCILCTCVSLIFVPLILYLMFLNGNE